MVIHRLLETNIIRRLKSRKSDLVGGTIKTPAGLIKLTQGNIAQ
jgi:hypothetical protein